MADTVEFFTTVLPAKIAGNEDLKTIGASFQFVIADAGTWTLDLNEGTVVEGAGTDVGCIITTDKATWEAILDNPGKAIQMFMMGKLKATNIGLATQLQKILA